MSWDNYGKIWQIDHILPIELFDLTNQEQQKICFNYSNLQPLLISDNTSKQDLLPNGKRARELTSIQKKEYLKELKYIN
jgi:hypothetical protein